METKIFARIVSNPFFLLLSKCTYSIHMIKLISKFETTSEIIRHLLDIQLVADSHSSIPAESLQYQLNSVLLSGPSFQQLSQSWQKGCQVTTFCEVWYKALYSYNSLLVFVPSLTMLSHFTSSENHSHSLTTKEVVSEVQRRLQTFHKFTIR